MINTTTKVILQNSNSALKAGSMLAELNSIIKSKTKYDGRPFNTITNLQARGSLALPIFIELRNGSKLTEADIHSLYELSICAASNTQKISELYFNLTGVYPTELVDATSLRVPVRALFVKLWAEQSATLPYNFKVDGVFAKFPELQSLTEGFAYKLAIINSKHTGRCTKTFQYRTNWHSASQVSFEDLWLAAPEVCNAQAQCHTPSGANHYFSYLSWVALFATKHPHIISQRQAYHLEKYHLHLHGMYYNGRDLRACAKSYKEFEDLWVIDHTQEGSMGRKERENARYKHRQKKWHIESSLQQKERSLKIITLQGISTPEEAFALAYKLPRAPGVLWIENGYYVGREHVDIQSIGSNWAIAAESFYTYIDTLKIQPKAKSNKKKHITFMLDYILCYLPLWLEKNPESLIRQPIQISDFARPIFWKSTTTKSSAFAHFATPDTPLLLPKTLLEIYLLNYSKKNSKTFINSVYDFFEHTIINSRTLATNNICYVDDDYYNPVHPKLDAPGSGSRGKTDKEILPIESTVIARAYILALDEVGVRIRDKILSGEISENNIHMMTKSDWIDLEPLGICTSIKIWNPENETQSIEIPLVKVVNAYSWKLDHYLSPGGKTRYVYIPWMSTIRMLTIAMHGGLRLQNCQWLDIHSFDSLAAQSMTKVLPQCTLYVNTDKNGKDRPVTIEKSVMASLRDERIHQQEIYAKPVLPVKYERDENDVNGYGDIYPLFRSPWSPSGYPFNDGTYAQAWIKVLIGIEDTYNSFVEDDNKHSFTKRGKNGNILAVHTPHALRATWITHIRIYGYLDFALIGLQVAHSNALISNHYIVPDIAEITKQISLSQNRVGAQAFTKLTGIPHKPSSLNSALVRGWEQNALTTAKSQNAISLVSTVIETQLTGQQLIATTAINKIAFLDNCVCMLNGACPKALLDFTFTPRVCGLCPYAVFCTDHLPGINVKIRTLTLGAEALREQISNVKAEEPNCLEIPDMSRRLTLYLMERAGYMQASEILTNLITNGAGEKYLTRHSDLQNAVAIETDMNDPVQFILSSLMDSSTHQHFSSENYPKILYRLAQKNGLDKIITADTSQKRVYVSQIYSIMRTTGITFKDLAHDIHNNLIASSDHAHKPVELSAQSNYTYT